MTAAGWTVMIVSVSSVFALSLWCVYRAMTLPPNVVEDHLKAPLDIDTHDLDS